MANTHDPRDAGPKPPFPQQPQTHPGSVHKMDPPADHGEESYVGTRKLEGRVAIITGGDSGIGRAVAIAFGKEGANVVLSFLPEEQSDADDTASVIEKSGARVVKVAGDIRNHRDNREADHYRRQSVRSFGHRSEQRWLSDVARGHCRTLFRRTGPYISHQCICDVPAEPGGAQEASCRRCHFKHDFHPGIRPESSIGRLCRHKGGHFEHDQEHCRSRDQTRCPSECGRARPGMDTADSVHDATRKSQNIWRQYRLRAPCAADRIGEDLCLSRFGGS